MNQSFATRSKSRIGLVLAVMGLMAASGCQQGPPAEGSLRVNINACTLTELETIPGIGEALAKLIVARRPYKSVDELLDVKGIGPASLEKLRTYVKVDGGTEKLH
jgi:competence ComEA-like helix-hairpin-helix protein